MATQKSLSGPVKIYDSVTFQEHIAELRLELNKCQDVSAQQRIAEALAGAEIILLGLQKTAVAEVTSIKIHVQMSPTFKV